MRPGRARSADVLGWIGRRSSLPNHNASRRWHLTKQALDRYVTFYRRLGLRWICWRVASNADALIVLGFELSTVAEPSARASA
jgi:hypothetical protein